MPRNPEKGPAGKQGGRGGPSPVEGLARALGRPAGSIALLPPEEGRALRGRFEECRAAISGSRPAGVPLVTSTRDRAVVEGVLAWLAGRVPEQDAVLLRPEGDAGGAAHTTATEVLTRALDLLGLDPSTEVRAMSPDASFGLALAVVRDERAGEETIYRLVSWGFRAEG